MGADYVKYDVVYPMPLVQVPSKYTNSEGNLLKLRLRMIELLLWDIV